MTKINMNSQARVHLTPVGLEACRRNRAALNLTPLDPHLQEDGTYRDQLWSLMRDFGGLMGMGQFPPFDMNIEVEEGI